MAGIDAQTGKVLDGFEHVSQSLGKILSTRQGERVMREWFGNPGLKLLGEPQTDRTILLWFNVIYMLIEIFEPRFRVIQFDVNSLTQNGWGDFTMNGEYRPYAQLDFIQAKAYVSIKDGSITLRIAT